MESTCRGCRVLLLKKLNQLQSVKLQLFYASFKKFKQSLHQQDLIHSKLRRLRILPFEEIHAHRLCCLQVQWPLNPSLEHLQNQVDKFKVAWGLLKDLASATAQCGQWKSSKIALEKHFKDEEANRKKEEPRIRKLQDKSPPKLARQTPRPSHPL